jgi:hypothetical protein
MSSSLRGLFPTFIATMAAIAAATSTLPSAAHAAAAGEFDYPELLVTPRASDRITTEAAKEPGNRWTSLVPMQVSALATLTAGIFQQTADTTTLRNLDSGLVGIGTGGALLAASFAIEALYSPYASAAREIAAMPAKTPREQLTRERAAEEAIRAAARMHRRIKWISVLANAGVNGYMASQNKSATVPMAIDGVAFLFAFAPVVFGSHAENVHNEQESYKKRIYAPIASVSLLSEPGTGNAVPGATLRLSF